MHFQDHKPNRLLRQEKTKAVPNKQDKDTEAEDKALYRVSV